MACFIALNNCPLNDVNLFSDFFKNGLAVTIPEKDIKDSTFKSIYPE